jgi:hypothetical protein
MAILQTRVFVNHTESGDWAETLVGKLVRPIVVQYHDSLEWFWFSRYVCVLGMPGEDTGDCDLDVIPEPFKGVLPGLNRPGHRSLRFRFEIGDGAQQAFEVRLRELLTANGYAISDVRHYDEVGDTGGERFLGAENRSPDRLERRARLVTHVFYTACQLLIDMLVGPDANGRYRTERNTLHRENPNGSCFESVHHVFCNVAQVPLSVLVNEGEEPQILGTYWGPPIGNRQLPRENGQTLREVYLQY